MRAFSEDVEKLQQPAKPNTIFNHLFYQSAEDEELSYSISFSDVTWGEDLSAHIGRYIESKFIRSNFILEFIRKIKLRNYFPIVMFVIMGLAFYSADAQVKKIDSAILESYNNLETLLSTIDQKIDFLIKATVDKASYNVTQLAPGVIFVLWTGYYIVVFVGVTFLIGIRKVSFVTLNDFSIQFAKRYDAAFDAIKYLVAIATVVGITSGVFANKIFAVLTNAHLL